MSRPIKCRCGECITCKRREYQRKRYINKETQRVERVRAAWDLKKKTLARNTLNNAIQSGKIERQPCSVCGISPADAHHTNYTKPLDVVWLCKTHHGLATQETDMTVDRRKKGLPRGRPFEQKKRDSDPSPKREIV
jgi:hypothetical protein